MKTVVPPEKAFCSWSGGKDSCLALDHAQRTGYDVAVLLNMLADPACPRPAAIIGCPVGFVGAAESKAALMADAPAPALIVEGRLGGSAITVAAVNALASRRE